VDVLINQLSEPKRKFFVMFGLLAGALFTGAIATMGASFVWHNGANYAFHHAFSLDMTDLIEGPTTPDLEWPTWIIYMAIPLGSSLMCFRFLQVAWNFARTGELPHHDHGHVDGLDDEPAKA
jgi:C4-dicarboxylate transporter DctQ subunit